MRPLGDIARAMLQHASTPGTVREVCERAHVGYGTGAYTASRLLSAGLLVADAKAPAPQRAARGRPPMVVMVAPEHDDEGVVHLLQRAFALRRPTALEWDAL
jgi:hypothetical protein